MVRTSDVSNYISASDLRKGDIVKFLDEGQIVDDKFNKGQQKIVIKVSLNGEPPKLMSPNATIRNHLKKCWGDDIANWVGKRATVDFVKKEVMGEIKDVAFLEPVDGWDDEEKDQT